MKRTFLAPLKRRKRPLLPPISVSAGPLVILLIVLPPIFLLGVLVGVMAHKYKPIPYRIGAAAHRAVFALFERPLTVADLAKYYSLDYGTVPLNRTVDTALLPIHISGIRLIEHLPLPRAGGAIMAIDNAVLILDRLGNIYLRTAGGDVRKLAFPPFPNRVLPYLAAGNRLHPSDLRAYRMRYLKDRKALVVSHEAFDPAKNATRMVVSLISFDANSFTPSGEWETIFSGEPELYGSNVDSGGALAIDGNGHLLLTIGDYQLSRLAGMFDGSKFGRIVVIDPRTGESRTLSTGHRNPQGIVVAKGGQIFSVEHGPAGGDEFNLIVEGANYGWPHVSLGTSYEGFDWGQRNVGRHDGYRSPLSAWLPAVAVSDLIQIEGFHERWNGDLLVGSLKGQSLFRLRLEGTRVLYAEPIFIGQRIRSLAQLSDGTIVLWTDDAQLLELTPEKDGPHKYRRPTAALNGALHNACMYCHHFGPTSPASIAPSLSGLFKRQIASDNYRYTPALRDKKGPWSETSLREFLLDPAAFASGTSMPQPHVDADEVDEIIQILKEVSDTSK
jgi:aldose sugar dehydrogenase